MLIPSFKLQLCQELCNLAHVQKKSELGKLTVTRMPQFGTVLGTGLNRSCLVKQVASWKKVAL